jgi:integral membrane protein (TIGR00529 family)
MTDLLKTAVVLVLIIVLLRRKVSMAAVMPIGALVLALIYLTPPRDFLKAAFTGVFAPKSLEMTITLMLTMVMENILRTTGMLKRMVGSLSEALTDRRLVMAAMPAMIGMLPSPGGAIFSAPMVNEAAGDAVIEPEQKALINYWYRHVWEYISPLYPGVILAAGLTGLSTQTIFLANLPFSLSVVGWGVLFCFRGIGRQEARPSSINRKREFLTFLAMISPIMLAMLLVVIFRVKATLALGGAVLALYAVHRYSPAMILKNLRESVSGKALFLVIGIMIFQEVLRTTGALAGISGFFAASQMPVYLLLFLNTRSAFKSLLVMATVPFSAIGAIAPVKSASVGRYLPLKSARTWSASHTSLVATRSPLAIVISDPNSGIRTRRMPHRL